jgi:2-dehydro-3-deoxyphosphooctonate aldolase (KDO 8-P synthase)
LAGGKRLRVPAVLKLPDPRTFFMLTISGPDTEKSFQVGNGSSLCLIAGPCVIESRDMVFRHAEALCQSIARYPDISFVFKSSYDKANRTSLNGFRGIGMEEGLRILQDVRSEFSVPVITDIHSPEEARSVSEVADILQIPAFLCRQTDLLLAAGACGKPVQIKKGQFLHPLDMKYAADKVASGGSDQVLLCERGTCFGYRDLVVDFRSFSIMKDLGYPVVYDVTHSVQSMGGAGGASSGNRSYVPSLACAAISYGVDALFIECHENPDAAPSDGPNMLTLEMFDILCHNISLLWDVRKSMK